MTTLSDYIKNKNVLYTLIGGLVAIAILLLDISIPLGVADGVLYISLVLISLFTKNKKFIYIGAITGTLFTIIGFFMSPPGGELWQALTNLMSDLEEDTRDPPASQHAYRFFQGTILM